MRINHKVLSIPPFISTSWKNISSMTIDEKGTLVVILNNENIINIPNLEKTVIEAIFEAHSKFLESPPETAPTKAQEPKLEGVSFGFPMKVPEGNMEALGQAMQHCPENANAPDLPEDILGKITAVAKALGLEDPEAFPKPEPHCNCMHCQVAKALHGKTNEKPPQEEEVTDEDLHFRTWDIEQQGEKLYIVTNPLDTTEQYNVFLGTPIGCTCGENNCEHIRSVLNS